MIERTVSRNRDRRPLLAACLYLTAAIIPAYGYEWDDRYNLNLLTKYHSNLTLGDPNVDTFEATLDLVAKAKGTSEISNLDFSAIIGAQEFSESDLGGETRYGANILWDRLGERSILAINLDVQVAPTNLTEELLDSGIVTIDGQTETYIARPSIIFNLSQRSAISTGLNHEEKKYDTDLLVDYSFDEVFVGWAYKINPQNILTPRIRYSEYEPDGGEVTRFSKISLTYETEAEQGVVFTLSAGVTDLEAPDSSDREPEYLASMEKVVDEYESYRLVLSSSYEVSSTGAVREEDRISGSYLTKATDRSRYEATLDLVDPEDFKSIIKLGFIYTYVYSQDIELNSGLGFQRAEGTTGDVESSTSFMISLNYIKI